MKNTSDGTVLQSTLQVNIVFLNLNHLIMKESPITGILWWTPEQWERAKQISADSQIFDDTYQEWKESADKSFKNFRDLGYTVYKIEIDLDELIDWCNKKNIPLDGNARSGFVSGKVKTRHESKLNNGSGS